ncbi:serine/threonine-protein kinase [Streptomyces anandii]|uniref:serine/threonine-protein kinase n=1 Tax=Streptomyces anandii TaxID=285454 RepID=UPI003701AB3B
MPSLERIGRYRLERRLGTGAFGTVWLAHDDVLDAPVAVKVLAENWAHRLDVRERFLSEARLLRKADSPRVVQVYDIGELPDGRPYFVMEYADGGTLADLCDGAGPLPVPEALRLTAQAARSAHALHEAGIVHRDVKPGNVLLRTAPDGTRRVLLADLGLAKSLAEASGLTLAAGSAGYRPPEQARAGAGIDARADVYSLGAVGYRLVTGAVPATPGEVVPPGRLRPDLDPAVGRALMRALEPDRGRRPADAAAFAAELEALAENPPPAPRSRRRLTRSLGHLPHSRPPANAVRPPHPADPATDHADRAPAQANRPPSPTDRPPARTNRTPDHADPAPDRVGRAPGRGRALVLAAAAVAAVVGVVAGGVGIAWVLRPAGPAGVVVQDATGRVGVRVPDGWARQLRGSGWDPRVLGLPAGHEPGLAVADDLARWQDLGADARGVFAGLSEHGDVTARVNALAHPGCHYAGARAWTGPHWHGRIRAWTGCADGGRLTETALVPAGGAAQPQLYVQIRQPDGADATDRILRSLRVT